MRQHRIQWAGVGCLIVLLTLLAIPLRNTIIRLGIVASTALLLLIAVRVSWNWRHLGKTLLVMFACVGGWMMATIQLTPVDSASFAAALRSYKGTVYVWGGETHRGIDCSGLIRMSLRDSYLAEGRIGAAGRIWFTDSAARDLSHNYQAILSTRGAEAGISQIDHAQLPPGTIAVTRDGIHTLAYLGDGTWIQASPDDGEVVIKPAMASDRWLETPVVLHTLRQ